MKNINSKWLWAFGIILVVLNLYSLYERNRVEHENEKLKVEKLNLTNELHTTRDNILKRTILQFKSEDVQIDLSLSLIAPSVDDTTSLSEVIGEKKKLVFKYSEVTCQVCVDQVFAKIDTLINAVGQDRLLLMANYENPRDLYTFKRVNNIDRIIYNLGEENLGLAAEQSSGPIFFVAYPNGKISHLFLPDKSMPGLTDEYIKFMRTNFSQF